MKVIGVLLLVGGALFGLFGLMEFMRYVGLGSNMFAGIALNSALYCFGIAATAILAGIGFLIAPSKPGL